MALKLARDRGYANVDRMLGEISYEQFIELIAFERIQRPTTETDDDGEPVDLNQQIEAWASRWRS